MRYRGPGSPLRGPGRGFLTVPRYRRVVVKLSGEALAGKASTGVDPASLSRVAQEVLSLRDLGVQVAVVIGDVDRFKDVNDNHGHAVGDSVLETIEAVRKVSGRNFAIQYAARRPGDIMTMVADTGRIRSVLDWTPRYDDLDTIAGHALAWEEKLFRERHGDLAHAASA